MNTIVTLWHTCQNIVAAHPEASHYLSTGLYWLAKSVGLLRSLDWAWNKMKPVKKDEDKDHHEDHRQAA